MVMVQVEGIGICSAMGVAEVAARLCMWVGKGCLVRSKWHFNRFTTCTIAAALTQRRRRRYRLVDGQLWVATSATGFGSGSAGLPLGLGSRATIRRKRLRLAIMYP